jgi:hypothetical protein
VRGLGLGLIGTADFPASCLPPTVYGLLPIKIPKSRTSSNTNNTSGVTLKKEKAEHALF